MTAADPGPSPLALDAGTTLAAAAATLLGAVALSPVFTAGGWFPPVLAAVAVVAAAGLVLRAAGAVLWARVTAGRSEPPRWGALGVPLVPLGQLAALACLFTALFAPGQALFGWLPTPASLADLGQVLADGSAEIREQTTPALPLTGLVALTALLVGIVAVTIDLIAVGGRQPALAALGLLLVFCVPVSTVTGGIGLAAVAAPAAGLALLLWADQHRRLAWRPRQGRRSTLLTGAGAALRTGALALVAAVLLGGLVPTLAEGELAAGWGDGSGGGGSTGTSLDPVAELQGQLTRDEPIDLLRLEASVPDPGYLRAVALDVYDSENGWTLSNLDGETTVDGDRLGSLPGSATDRQVQAQITAIEHDDRFLPLLYAPVAVSIDDAPDWRFDPTTSTVFGRDTTTAGHTYRQLAQEPRPSPAELVDTPALPPGDPLQERYTALPELDPGVTDLVASLTAGAETPYERVQAVYGFLTDRANGWIYSLATAPGTSGDDLADFLRLRRGYCEQYAGSMAVMVRAAGVPARVALGYTPGLVQPDGSRLVSSDDAHAWVEVYFEGSGWVPYDPTPIDVDRAVELPWAPRPQDLEVDPRTDVTAAPAPVPEPTVAPVEGVAEEAPEAAAAADSAGWLRPALPVLGVLLAVAALLALPAGVRALQRRRRLATGTPAALWDELAATARDLGLPWAETQTPRQVAARLAQALPGSGGAHRAGRAAGGPGAREAVAVLAGAEEAASYARPGSAPPADLAVALRTARRGLLGAAAPATRLRALLLPASVPAGLRDSAPVRRLRALAGRTA
ncbi:transglutaminase family protein [Blastococcus sp. SYSU D00820]